MTSKAQSTHLKQDDGINMSDSDIEEGPVVELNPSGDKNKPVDHNQIQLTKLKTGALQDKLIVSDKIHAKNIQITRQSVMDPNEDTEEAEDHGNAQETKDYFEDEVIADSRHSSAVSNMKLFQKNYGVTFEIPSIYVLNSIFYPKNPLYSLQIVIQVIPESEKLQVVNHYLKSDTSNVVDNAIQTKEHQQHSEWIMLRLVKLSNYQTEVVDQIELKQCKKAIIKFSDDGNRFSLYMREDQELRIFDSSQANNITKLIQKVKNDDSFAEYTGEETSATNNLEFITDSVFDKNNRFFIGYGKTKIFIFNYQKEVKISNTKIFKIKSLFEGIFALRLTSSSNQKYICMVACKKKDRNQISIYDIAAHANCSEHDNHFDGTQENKDQIDMIYNHDMSKDNSKIEMSLDSQKIVFVNGQENYLFEKKKVQGGGVQLFQNNIDEIKNKKVWKIIPYFDSFVFVISDEYDNKIQVISIAEKQKFTVTIDKQFEPGRLNIFDIHLKSEQEQKDLLRDNYNWKNIVTIVCLNDDELDYHQIEYNQQRKEEKHVDEYGQSSIVYKFDQSDFKVSRFMSNSIKSFSFNWPYFTFSAIEDGYVMIINCYDKEKLHRVQITKDQERCQVVDSFITETMDLFVITQKNIPKTQKIEYDLFVLDLDGSNQNEQIEDKSEGDMFQFEFLYRYTSEDVGDQRLENIFCRGSSRKESIDCNNNLFVFFIHSKNIFSWNDSTTREQEIQNLNATSRQPIPLRHFGSDHSLTHQRKIFNSDSQSFYFLNTEKKIQQVIKVEISFSSFEIKTIFSWKAITDEIETFSLDKIKNYFILLLRPVQEEDNDGPLTRKFKIFCSDKMELIYEANLYDQENIGRLRSGLFEVVDGHIYFNNNVIKIRYELILSKNHYSEDQIFNTYNNIFNIETSHLHIKSTTPFNSLQGHRFAYILSDNLHFQTKQLFILPYLHERKLYLHRNKFNTDYFYSTIETLFTEDKDFREKTAQGKGMERFSSINTKLKKISNSYVSIGKYQEAKEPMTLTLNSEVASNKKSLTWKGVNEEIQDQNLTILEKQKQRKTFTTIVVMNQSEYKYYIYTLNGLLQNRIDFREEVDFYGTPIAVSDNGQNYIFKKRHEFCKTIGQYMTVSIIHLTAFGMMRLKEIDVFKQLTTHMAEMAIPETGMNKKKQLQKTRRFQQLQKDIEILMNATLEEVKAMRFEFQVNDKLDICVRIKPSQIKDTILGAFGRQDDHHDHDDQEKIIYYYEAGSHTDSDSFLYTPREEWPASMLHNLSLLEQSDEKEGIHNKNQNIFVSTENKNIKFLMNNRYLFFFDMHEVSFIDSRYDYYEKDLQKLNFTIKDRDHRSHIKNVKTGSNQNIITITVDQTEDQYTVFSWNVLEDAEYEAYDVGKKFDVIWDSKGIPIIVTGGIESRVILSKERCSVRVFDTRHNLESILLRDSKKQFPLCKGHRFDNEGHNWILLREYLGLSFSYMTFVIKAKHEAGKMVLSKKGNFDFEPYNYILNRSTCFLKEDFIEHGFQELKQIFKRWIEFAPGLLDLVTYPQYVLDKDKKQYINTPLKIAVNKQSMRTIDLILKTMSKVEQNNSVNFKSIFPDLLQYESFQDYLTNLPVQTRQMTIKQILKTNRTKTKDIVNMTHSSTIQIGPDFYRTQMGEDTENPNQRNFPVDVKAMRIDWFIMTEDGKKFLQALLNYNDLAYYRINTIQMIIEYLFNRFRNVIMLTILPIYIFQVVFFSLTLLQYHQQGNMTEEHKKWTRYYSKWNLGVNIFSLCYNFYIFVVMPKKFFFRLITWNDLIFAAINIYLNSIILRDMKDPTNIGAVNKVGLTSDITMTIRQLLMIGIIIIFLKLLYFLALIGYISPLIIIIKAIIHDIRWFSFICGLFIYSLSMAFYIIGNNQEQFDGAKPGDIAPYNTQWGAVGFVWDIIIGQQDTGMFAAPNGKGQYYQILWALFTICAVVLFIIFLNMLVAIMGNTFATRIAILDDIIIQDHLFFVVDNWHLLNIAFLMKTKSVKYIITAFFKEDEEDENQEMLNILDSSLDKIDIAQREIATSLSNIVGKLDQEEDE